MCPKVPRNATDFVYRRCKIATVEDESENNATFLARKDGARASKAIYTTFNSLKVICFWAPSLSQLPDTRVLGWTCCKCAPKPKSLESVNKSSSGSEGSQGTLQKEVSSYVQKYFKDR
jgi:hypothetical protein